MIGNENKIQKKNLEENKSYLNKRVKQIIQVDYKFRILKYKHNSLFLRYNRL